MSRFRYLTVIALIFLFVDPISTASQCKVDPLLKELRQQLSWYSRVRLWQNEDHKWEIVVDFDPNVAVGGTVVAIVGFAVGGWVLTSYFAAQTAIAALTAKAAVAAVPTMSGGGGAAIGAITGTAVVASSTAATLDNGFAGTFNSVCEAVTAALKVYKKL